MKWWVLVLGLCSSPAFAGQWSADACQRLQEIKDDIRATSEYDIRTRSAMIFPILEHQIDNCGGHISQDSLVAEMRALVFKRTPDAEPAKR
jgi:hypothetical protein